VPFFAGEINTRSNVLANPMLACMTLVSQFYLSSQSLAKLASLSSTLLEIRALFARQSSLGSGAKDSLARNTQNFFV